MVREQSAAKRISLFHVSIPALSAFFLTLLLCSGLVGAAIIYQNRTEHITMERVIVEKGAQISEVISRLLHKTQALAALVVQGRGEVQEFDRVAAALVDDPAIKNLLLAPDGVVNQVYPLAGNEGVVGFDLLGGGDGNKEAVQAYQLRDLVIGGPFTLVQGGQAMVGRLPIWLDDNGGAPHFWGMVSVTLNYPQALDGAQLDALKDQGLAYEIWRISPDSEEKQIIASSDYPYNPKTRFVEKSVSILNAEWFFRILPVRGWYEYAQNWLQILIGIGISLLVAFTAQRNHELKLVKTELEHMVVTDPLTGLPNRKGLLSVLDKLVAGKEKFQVCYIDLNYFKQINDAHGHHAGDLVLAGFSQRMRGELDAGQILGRIGGDEFLLIFTGASQEQKTVDEFWIKIDKAFSAPLVRWKDQDIVLSFSRGVAHFPQDGATVDTLVSYADKKMYWEKHYRYSIEKRRRASDYRQPTLFQKLFN